MIHPEDLGLLELKRAVRNKVDRIKSLGWLPTRNIEYRLYSACIRSACQDSNSVQANVKQCQPGTGSLCWLVVSGSAVLSPQPYLFPRYRCSASAHCWRANAASASPNWS